MVVLQLISSEGYYGAENVLVNLAGSLEKMGCRSIVGVFRNAHRPHVEVATHAQNRGLHVEIISCRGKADRKAVDRIRQCIRDHSVDLVHMHGYKADLYGYAAARDLGRPVIATYHIDWPDRGIALRVYHVLDRLVVRRFDRIVAVSDKIARSLQRSGVPREKVTTIPNGIDLSAFARPASGVPISDRPGRVVGLVGRLTPQKGPEYFLRAARSVLDALPDVVFAFIGGGPERERLEALSRELGIERSVVFAGQRNDMPAVYASLDLVVLPSINEGLPMALIEALAARRPVVATRVGAVPELIEHERTGLLVEPRDVAGLQAAIRRLLTDSELGRRLGENGHVLVNQRFSAEAMAQSYLSLYLDVLKKDAAAGIPWPARQVDRSKGADHECSARAL